MAQLSDPYRLLGVQRDASLAQVKAAHRKLAKRYHPDSPTADAQRFLRVQEAYQLLSDPLRRREWDARHAPAPVRADEPAGSAPRGRSRRTPSPAAREQAARNYTWSAGEVPWWEEGGRRAARPGPTGGPAAEQPLRGAPPRRRAQNRDEDAAPPPAPTEPRPDFDVYNRSSGAAWSAAARAYFRRADQDLPRRGSFQYQGSQPLTAARARAAAEEQARRQAAPPTPQPVPRRRAAASAAQPPAPEAGIARDASTVARVRARFQAEQRAGRWPSRFQRLRYALLAWAPLALLIGYGGPAAAECQPALASCSPMLVPGQALVAGLLLGLLLAAPRLAYAGAQATTALVVGGGVALLGAWLTGLRAPQLAALPAWALLAGAAALALAYLIVAIWLLSDRGRRPWAGVRITR
jgi:curved DNA-binding protein CbpA